MAVRNFWLECDIDGRKTRLRGGPQGAGGGLVATLYIRDEGAIERAVTLDCYADNDGTLVVLVDAAGHDDILVHGKR